MLNLFCTKYSVVKYKDKLLVSKKYLFVFRQYLGKHFWHSDISGAFDFASNRSMDECLACIDTMKEADNAKVEVVHRC